MDTFYEENQENNIRLLKNKMTLDFNSPTSHSKKAKLMKTCILESPDLKMLKLASPELESMIIQQNGLVTTTPTPSSLYTPYFLKQEQEPTEEQEQYARGFVDALNQLHQTNGHQQPSDVPTTTSTGQALNQQQNTSNCLQNYNSNNNNNNQNNSHLNSNSNNNYLNSNAMIIKLESTTGQHTSQQTTQQQQSSQQKSNPSSMNCQLEMRGLSPPMSSSPLPPPQSSLTQPIDMEDQERIKLERKRLRNRIAASKCRRRKLERISKLEDKVKALKGENSELSIVVNKLRDQVCSLKQRVMDHVKCGCQLMVSQ